MLSAKIVIGDVDNAKTRIAVVGYLIKIEVFVLAHAQGVTIEVVRGHSEFDIGAVRTALAEYPHFGADDAVFNKRILQISCVGGATA